jgi:hypothetical protein
MGSFSGGHQPRFFARPAVARRALVAARNHVVARTAAKRVRVVCDQQC